MESMIPKLCELLVYFKGGGPGNYKGDFQPSDIVFSGYAAMAFSRMGQTMHWTGRILPDDGVGCSDGIVVSAAGAALDKTHGSSATNTTYETTRFVLGSSRLFSTQGGSL